MTADEKAVREAIPDESTDFYDVGELLKSIATLQAQHERDQGTIAMAEAALQIQKRNYDSTLTHLREENARLKAPTTAMEWSRHCDHGPDGRYLATNGQEVFNRVIASRAKGE